MTSGITEQVQHQQAVTAAKTRSIVLPAALAILLFALIAYIQFSLVLGQYGFFAELPLAIGFYYCWAWHLKLRDKAQKLEAK
jgi:hypothetical protein